MSENEQKPQTEEQPKVEENAAPPETTVTEPATKAVEENGVKEDGEAPAEVEEEKKKEEGGAEGKTENAAPAAEAAKPAEPVVDLEAPKENPFSEDDLEQILQLEASDGEDNGWQKGKNQKGVTIFKKSEKNGMPIIKAYMEFSGIPCEKVLELLTNVEERKKWNKKTPTYEVLEEREDFKIIYQVVKMPTACDDRDMVQSTIVRSDQEQKRHVILYKACNHPNKPPNTKGAIRADVPLMGIIIRPKEEEENTTKLTWLSQIGLKGWVPKMIVNRVTMHYPVSLCDDLTQYWKKLHAPKEEPKKDKKADGKDAKKEEGGEEAKKEDKKEDGEEEKKEEEKKEEEPEKPKENGETAPAEEAATPAKAAAVAEEEDKPAAAAATEEEAAK